MSNILANNINPRSGTSIDVGGALQVGSATTIHTTGIDLGSGNIQLHNINSTGIITATSASFSENVSIGGTLTYEDVTSIDSVGIITAQSGLKVSSGITTISGTLAVNGNNYPSTGQLSHRNIIINGAMRVAQRGTSVSAVTATGIYTCDRMPWTLNNCGEWTNTQETNGPNGFGYSYKAMCGFGDASPAADDYALLQYLVESTDIQHLSYGTSDAVPMTISFYVKSNKTGAASFAIMQMQNSGKTFAKTYTINAADTWEYKTITIPADTSGNINNDNGNGLLLEWWCNSGSNFTGGTHPSTWFAQNDINRNASNIGIGQATDDYFQITGIQLEVGEVATPFETRPISEELLRCQRYFIRQDWVLCNNLQNIAYRWIPPGPNVNMRSIPSMAYFNPNTGTANQTYEHSSTTTRTINAAGNANSATTGSSIYFGTSTNGTYAQYVRVHMDAEL